MSGWLTAQFPKFSQDRLLLVVDLIGTFVFAVEGALAGIDAGHVMSLGYWCCRL
jgi:uncharacterized membrane protein YeiH